MKANIKKFLKQISDVKTTVDGFNVLIIQIFRLSVVNE